MLDKNLFKKLSKIYNYIKYEDIFFQNNSIIYTYKNKIYLVILKYKKYILKELLNLENDEKKIKNFIEFKNYLTIYLNNHNSIYYYINLDKNLLYELKSENENIEEILELKNLLYFGINNGGKLLDKYSLNEIKIKLTKKNLFYKETINYLVTIIFCNKFDYYYKFFNKTTLKAINFKNLKEKIRYFCEYKNYLVVKSVKDDYGTISCKILDIKSLKIVKFEYWKINEKMIDFQELKNYFLFRIYNEDLNTYYSRTFVKTTYKEIKFENLRKNEQFYFLKEFKDYLVVSVQFENFGNYEKKYIYYKNNLKKISYIFLKNNQEVSHFLELKNFLLVNVFDDDLENNYYIILDIKSLKLIKFINLKENENIDDFKKFKFYYKLSIRDESDDSIRYEIYDKKSLKFGIIY